MSAADQFMQAIAAAGLAPRGDFHLVSDGKLQRYRVEGDKPGSHNGWAVFYGNAGAFGSWKSGETHTWCERTTTPLSPAQRVELQIKIKTAQEARAAELISVQAVARDRAAKLWAMARPATNAHPYLRRKKIGAYGVRQLNGALVVAARDVNGVLNTLQFIAEDGTKRFLTGGRIVGCYFAIGRPVDSLLLCEGLATASTLHQATGRAVAVAFNCGNLVAVAKSLRSKFPALRMIVCADNDFATQGNPGVTHAQAAARAVGGFLAVPKFTAVSN